MFSARVPEAAYSRFSWLEKLTRPAHKSWNRILIYAKAILPQAGEKKPRIPYERLSFVGRVISNAIIGE